MTTPVTADAAGATAFQKRLLSPALLKTYFLFKLPLAAAAGLRLRRLDGKVCEVSVPFGWRTQNPFGSIYFAALSMAAELSCAGLALMAARGAEEPVSVLPVHIEGSFEKKATGLTTFLCEDGEKLFEGVNEALRTGESVHVTTTTVGRMSDGTLAARFQLTWSFKKKR